MSESYTLDVQTRTVIGKKVGALRRENMIPGVIYGYDMTPISITIPRRPLEIVLQKAGTTHLVLVNVGGETYNTLVREVQRDSIKRTIRHIDFLRVDLTKTLRTDVQVVLVGIPKLSADMSLSQSMLTIEVECLPTNIPTVVQADASKLTRVDARIIVADLPALPNVKYIAEPTEIVAIINALVELTEGADGELTLLEPEVVERGKKEADDEA
ncbi:MAG TPA: 50S ribosomal protein L25 [Aggregatilineales bacterium]|nr:50S ribosomal protein L25 [Anaerolineales bacterium]HRE49605.1 50S ribosomal protein L25 [Aggregatilineales bacterium]